jgi:hypothetical protein
VSHMMIDTQYTRFIRTNQRTHQVAVKSTMTSFVLEISMRASNSAIVSTCLTGMIVVDAFVALNGL